MKLMTARYRGDCKGCGSAFPAGTEIRHEGRGLAYHVECETTGATPAPTRPRHKGWGHNGRTSSGAWVTARRSRCEDAPCCGCCT